MRKIRIAIVGVEKCASSLVQGINFYDGSSTKWRQCGTDAPAGRPHTGPAISKLWPRSTLTDAKWVLMSAKPSSRRPIAQKSSAKRSTFTGAIVKMGCVFDGYPPHMRDQDPLRTFLPLEKESTREQIIAELKNSSAELMVNYLPVGSEEATRFYASCALEAGLGFVNNIPVFIASDPVWAKRFADKNLPIIGDDIKAQMGATILHRMIVDLFRKRGVKAGSHVSTEHRRQHRLPQHAESNPTGVQENVEDGSCAISDRRAPGEQRKSSHWPERLRAVAAR